MGGQNQPINSSWILQRYAYRESIIQQPFGRISVFRKKQQNYDYLMLMSRQIKLDHLKDITKQLQVLTSQHNNSPFLRVYDVFTGKQYLNSLILNKENHNGRDDRTKWKYSCLNNPQSGEVINICMEYLTYSLAEHLKYMKRNNQEIKLSQYAYILKRLISAAQLHENWCLSYLELDLYATNIFISPSGQIKIVPFRSKFLKEATSNCQCSNISCFSRDQKSTDSKQFYTFSSTNTKHRQKKYVKQIKHIELELFSTVNTNLEAFVRRRSNFTCGNILQEEEYNQILRIRLKIKNSESLHQLMNSLRNVQEDLIEIKGITAIEIRQNTQKYERLERKIELLNSLEKGKLQINQKEQQIMQVSRNIFDSPKSNSQSDSHTYSNMSRGRSQLLLPNQTNPVHQSNYHNIQRRIY